MRCLPSIVVAAVMSLALSAFLWITFGWVGELFLNMPGFGFASIVRGHEVSRFGPWMFLGNFVFYTLVFSCAVWGIRRIRGR